MLGVVSDTGLPQVIRYSRQGALGDVPQGFDHGRHDIFEVGNFRFIQYRSKAQFHIAGIVENGAEMGDIELPTRWIGGFSYNFV